MTNVNFDDTIKTPTPIIDSNSTKEFNATLREHQILLSTNEKSNSEEGWYSRDLSAMDIVRKVDRAFESTTTDNIVKIADDTQSFADGAINRTLDYLANNDGSVQKTHAKLSNITTKILTGVAEYASATQDDPAKPLKDTVIVAYNIATKMNDASEQWSADYKQSVEVGQSAEFLTKNTVNAGFIGAEMAAIGFAGMTKNSVKLDLSKMMPEGDINGAGGSSSSSVSKNKNRSLTVVSRAKDDPNYKTPEQKMQDEFDAAFPPDSTLSKEERESIKKDIVKLLKNNNALEIKNEKTLKDIEGLQEELNVEPDYSELREPDNSYTLADVADNITERRFTETKGRLRIVEGNNLNREQDLDLIKSKLEEKLEEKAKSKLNNGADEVSKQNQKKPTDTITEPDTPNGVFVTAIKDKVSGIEYYKNYLVQIKEEISKNGSTNSLEAKKDFAQKTLEEIVPKDPAILKSLYDLEKLDIMQKKEIESLNFKIEDDQKYLESYQDKMKKIEKEIEDDPKSESLKNQLVIVKNDIEIEEGNIKDYQDEIKLKIQENADELMESEDRKRLEKYYSGNEEKRVEEEVPSSDGSPDQKTAQNKPNENADNSTENLITIDSLYDPKELKIKQEEQTQIIKNKIRGHEEEFSNHGSKIRELKIKIKENPESEDLQNQLLDVEDNYELAKGEIVYSVIEAKAIINRQKLGSTGEKNQFHEDLETIKEQDPDNYEKIIKTMNDELGNPI